MLHTLHRLSGLLIGVFVLFHLLNHSLLLMGVQAHIDFMESARVVYRQTAVEVILLSCVGFQVVSGIHFFWQRKGQRVGLIEKAQVVSGLYLAYFLLNHVGAVLAGRGFAGLDTNIYYGIAGFHISPFHWYFIPYYFLAVVAVFVHLASAFYWLSRKQLAAAHRARVAYAIMLAGVFFSAILMASFAGVFSEIQIPAEYRAIYG